MHFEREFHKLLDRCYEIMKEKGRPLCTWEIIREMGRYMEDTDFKDKETSIIYWAYKNDIPIISTCFTDGSIGDILFFHRNKRKDFYVDISQDMEKIIKISMDADKTGVISLGGGSSKHYTLNAQIFREGCEFAVYINSHDGDDASDSGAEISEAVTWGKVKDGGIKVKVKGDASIIFPLIIAGTNEK